MGPQGHPSATFVSSHRKTVHKSYVALLEETSYTFIIAFPVFYTASDPAANWYWNYVQDSGTFLPKVSIPIPSWHLRHSVFGISPHAATCNGLETDFLCRPTPCSSFAQRDRCYLLTTGLVLFKYDPERSAATMSYDESNSKACVSSPEELEYVMPAAPRSSNPAFAMHRGI